MNPGLLLSSPAQPHKKQARKHLARRTKNSPPAPPAAYLWRHAKPREGRAQAESRERDQSQGAVGQDPVGDEPLARPPERGVVEKESPQGAPVTTHKARSKREAKRELWLSWVVGGVKMFDV